MPDSELQLFQFNTSPVRTFMVDGEPWFLVKDLCDILELSSSSRAIDGLDDEEKGRQKVSTLGGDQTLLTVNESGMYTLVIRSNKKEAKPFRKWVTNEVLPSIRKTGVYGTAALPAGIPTTRPGLLELAVEQEKKIQEQHAKLLSTRRPVLSMCPR